jgi:hypothetical protein
MQYLGQSASMGPPSKVVGPSTTQPSLFGVIGAFRPDQRFQALQQVFERPADGAIPKTMSGHINTSRNTFGKAPKTYIPGLHYGQVPFAGAFMSGHGDIEVIKGHKMRQ